MPELVKAGRLYKAIGPLYRIDDKNHEFVHDKREYVDLYQDKVIKNYEVTPIAISNKALDKDSFKEFIYDTEQYSDELVRLSKHFGVNKFLIERVAAYLTMKYPNKDMDELFKNSKFTTPFMEMVQMKYPEITLNGKHSLRGIVDGRFQSIDINNRFIRKIEDIKNTYIDYGYSLLVKDKKSGEKTEMSIGEFLDLTSKFKAKIITRFKGLGEANSKQLWDTTLNPDTRTLIQLTMDDVEKDLKIFEKLHGQSKQNVEDRKKMMSEYKIARDDLDN